MLIAKRDRPLGRSGPIKRFFETVSSLAYSLVTGIREERPLHGGYGRNFGRRRQAFNLASLHCGPSVLRGGYQDAVAFGTAWRVSRRSIVQDRSFGADHEHILWTGTPYREQVNGGSCIHAGPVDSVVEDDRARVTHGVNVV